MSSFVIGYYPQEARVVDSEGNLYITIKRPEIPPETDAPIVYEVMDRGGAHLGAILSFFHDPKLSRAVVRSDADHSLPVKTGKDLATIVENDTSLRLRKGGIEYDVSNSLEPLEDDKKLGFERGYVARSPDEIIELKRYAKDGKLRATLTAATSSSLELAPLIMLDILLDDAKQTKFIEKPKPAPVEKPKPKPAPAIIAPPRGPFAQHVFETHPPNLLNGSFPYLAQDGEFERVLEYLASGRPVLLNGPTGNGKSVLGRHVAKALGIPYYFDRGGVSFRVQQTIGQFVPGVDRPFYSPGPLTLAMVHGGLYALEEGAQVPRDEFTALNVMLETDELWLNTHLGPELLKAHPNFRLMVMGNFHNQYTLNEWNDAILQRFTQIKLGYPDEDLTTRILQERASGLDLETAKILTGALFKMREVAKKYNKDLGLKGAVAVAERVVAGSTIGIANLVLDNLINPLTTYEHVTDARKSNGSALAKDLIAVAQQLPGW